MPDHPELHKWLRKCRKNNRTYQEKVYRHYFPALERQTFSYTQDEQEQITLINDTFLSAFKSISQFNSEGSFEGWLRKILYRKMIDFKRKEKRNRTYELKTKNENDEESGLESLYYKDLEDKIKILPEATKKVFIKYAIEGYLHREIAEELGISEGTSKWHVSKARKMLQKIMNQEKRNWNAGK